MAALGQLSPTGLQHRSHGDFSNKVVDVSVTLTGGSAPAQAAPSSASVPVTNRQQLSPLGLSTRPRNFVARSVGNVSVTLLGAGSEAQGENLEGTNITLRPDGAQIVAAAGLISFRRPLGKRRSQLRGSVCRLLRR